MKEAALFYEDFLVPGPDGRYVFTPSYSPENQPRNTDSQASINATMDLAAARELLTHLVEAAGEPGAGSDDVARWSDMLRRLPDYLVNEDGALQEWAWPGIQDDYRHRHASHLYPLYYGLGPGFEDPALQAAARRAIELRLAERVREDGGVMAFGMVQLGQAASTLGDGETTFTLLKWLMQRFYYTNLASAHDPGPQIFNVDISGGVPDLVIRMLVQSAPGRVRLLPALPAGLPAGRIEGVLAHGQVEVRSLRWDGDRVEVVLRTARDQELTLALPRPIVGIRAPDGGDVAEQDDPRERRVRLARDRDTLLVIDLGPVP
jgi:alpha-L-fucosidase 2